MIDIHKPFCLYANCKVIYDGRASSVLNDGNYLVIYKSDKSVQVHGNTKIQPRNYQGSGSVVDIDHNIISFVNKKDKLLIIINNIIYVNYLEELSDDDIEIVKTESDLVDKLFNNFDDYIGNRFEIIEKEYQTEYGPVDLAGFTEHGEIHVVEVKRGKATLANCTQLKRYVEAIGGNVFGYLASPAICTNAMKYLEKSSMRWVSIGFN